MKRGRLCENGRPVPLDRPDWAKLTQGMRTAGRAALEAARAKNHEAAIEVTNQIADACANCHEVYRDKPDLRNRCIP
jgi:cytochrome c553